MRRDRSLDDGLVRLLSGLPEPVLLESDDRRVLWLNAGLAAAFQMSGDLDELVGVSSESLTVLLGDRVIGGAAFGPRMRALITGAQPVVGEEVRFVSGDVYERDYMPLELNDGSTAHLWRYHDVTAYHRLNRRLASRERAARSLLEIVARNGSASERLQSLLDEGAELLGMPAGLVTRLQPDGQLTVLAARDPDLRLQAGMNFGPGTTLGAATLTQAQPLAVADVSLIDRPEPAGSAEPLIGAYLGATISSDGAPWGTVAFTDPHPRAEPFGELEVDLVALMAGVVSSIVDSPQPSAPVPRSATTEPAGEAAVVYGGA